MILPKIRDPRFITVRRGGSLQDDDHRLLAIWAADCAQHVLHHFEQARPKDDRPRRAIDRGRAWARGEITWGEARTAAGHANAAARDLSGAAAMWRPTSSVLRPTRSGRRGRQRLKTSARRLAAWSASGSAPNSPTRSGNLCSTTSGCATSCAGLPSTADKARSRPSMHRVTRGQVHVTTRYLRCVTPGASTARTCSSCTSASPRLSKKRAPSPSSTGTTWSSSSSSSPAARYC